MTIVKYMILLLAQAFNLVFIVKFQIFLLPVVNTQFDHL